MRQHRRRPIARSILGVLVSVLGLWVVAAPTPAAAAATPDPGVITGSLTSGARYALSVPAHFNGTLLISSPGYIGGPAGGEATLPSGTLGQWLADNGYAVASSKPTTNGWAVEDLLRDQPELVATARKLLKTVRTTVAWGNSMGGLTTATLVERNPNLFDGGLAMCASVAGGVNMLNLGLDASFVFKTLLAPDDSALQLVNVTDEAARQQAAAAALADAEASPAGRARVALAAAVGQVSTWSQVGTPRPDPSDWPEQLRQQAAGFLFGVFSPRQPLEQRAGGNFSWNVGVDYATQLRRSGDLPLVEKAYRAAGLDLRADLETLAAAPRIQADPSAVTYMQRNAEPTGRLVRPVLTVHEVGDNAPVVSQAREYADAARRTGSARFLAQAFVDRPAHCTYTPAEVAASLTTLQDRIRSGRWGAGATPTALTRRARELDLRSPLDLGSTDFVAFRPRELIRTDDRIRDVDATLADGTAWSYAVPPNWDGRLVIKAGEADVGHNTVDQWLLDHGIALAGYDLSDGWDLAADRDHATAVRTAFIGAVAQPTSTVLTGIRSRRSWRARPASTSRTANARLSRSETEMAHA